MNKFLALANRSVRELGLLNITESIRYFVKVAKCYRSNRKFILNNPDFVTPPPELAFDAYSAPDWNFYKRSGEGTAEFLSVVIRKYMSSSIDTPKVFEWGCGPARVIRYLPDVLGGGAEISGSDYNRESIKWCTQNIPRVNFLNNELNPPLKVTENFFDVCYSISVFTHLSDDVCKAWANEIYRVLKPGGIFITTTNGESKLKDLFEDEVDKYKLDGFVVRGNYAEGKKMFFSCQSPQYLTDKVFSCFDVLQYQPASFPYTAQDLWVLRKPL